MPRPRFFKLPEEKRRYILEQAGDEFEKNGYHGASLNRLLDAAKLSKGSFYYYFDDRDDLFAAVLERELQFQAIPAEILKVCDPERYFALIQAWIEESCSSFFQSPRAMALVRDVARLVGASELPKAVAQMQEAFHHAVGTVLEAGQAAGAVRKDLPQDLLVMLVMKWGEAIDLWTIQHLDEVSDQSPAELVALAMGLFRRLVAPGFVSGVFE